MKLKELRSAKGHQVKHMTEDDAEAVVVGLWREIHEEIEASRKTGKKVTQGLDISGNPTDGFTVKHVDHAAGKTVASVEFRKPRHVPTGVVDENGDPIFRVE